MISVKEFVFNGLLAQQAISQLREAGHLLQSDGTITGPVPPIEQTDFTPRIVSDALRMAAVYVAFFCLENAVRELIEQRLLERKGVDWWDKHVTSKIRAAVDKLKEREQKNRYHSQRSVRAIGYTMFGNLAQIIIANWEEFSDLFPDQAWVTSRFNDLEMSRNVIMHTGVLPQIEIDRIESIVRDWIRQVG